jgi:plastocyanin
MRFQNGSSDQKIVRLFMTKARTLLVIAVAVLGVESLATGFAAIGRAAARPQASGTISGTVAFQGTPPKRGRLNMDADPVCSGKHADPVLAEDGEVNSNGTLPNAFVYLKDVTGTFQPPAKAVILDQHGCMYEPHVLGIMVGQELRIVSSDATTHNIHIMPKVNDHWNHSQLPGSAPLSHKFVKPEIMIPVECNEHPWMKAYIAVTSNPFYAVTADEGTFTINGVPPGSYTLETWTATFGTQEQKVTVRAGETAHVTLTFKGQ